MNDLTVTVRIAKCKKRGLILSTVKSMIKRYLKTIIDIFGLDLSWYSSPSPLIGR